MDEAIVYIIIMVSFIHTTDAHILLFIYLLFLFKNKTIIVIFNFSNFSHSLTIIKFLIRYFINYKVNIDQLKTYKS